MSSAPHYTKQEILFVHRNYLAMTDKQLASALNRKHRGIGDLRMKEGLIKGKVESLSKPGCKSRQLERVEEIRMLRRFIKRSGMPIWNDIAQQRIDCLKDIINWNANQKI